MNQRRRKHHNAERYNAVNCHIDDSAQTVPCVVFVVGDAVQVVSSVVNFSRRCLERRVVTIGQIASYVPGSSAGAACAAAAGKSVPRRRGARRDCDRISKAEDVPEYKGSLPVEELLAFVEGSVPSPGAVRMPADNKLRRTKRKEPSSGDGDLKLRNGDSKLVEVDLPVPQNLACLPHSESLNGLLNGSSKHSQKLVSELPVNFDSYVGDHFPENEWLSSELASHLMVNRDYSDGIIERKEKEFVLVQKKRRPKTAAAVNGDTKSVEVPNGFCLSRNGIGNVMHDGKEEYAYMNGFSTEEILETNGSAVSRNSSEGSFAQSFSSDIDDLSHFVGEDGIDGGELYVDAPLSWNDADDEDDDDDDKEVSLSSFCSTMSSTESRQRLNSPSSHTVASPDIDQTDFLSQDGRNMQSDRQPGDCVSTCVEQDDSVDSCMIPAAQRLKTDSSTVSELYSDHFHCRCPHLCCTVPYKHVQHQTPVVFCDSERDRNSEDVSSVVFSFGCAMYDHLVDGGLCKEAKRAAVSPDTESELNGVKHLCSESPDDSAASLCDGIVSFMYSNTIPQCTSSSTQCTELLQNCTRTCSDDDMHSNTDTVDRFQVHDIQSYMYASKYSFVSCIAV